MNFENIGFGCRQTDVFGQTERVEKFDIVFGQVGKNKVDARLLRRVNYAEQNRNADAVDEFGSFEIDDQRAAALFNLTAAFAFGFFAAQFIQITVGVNNRNISGSTRRYAYFALHWIH